MYKRKGTRFADAKSVLKILREEGGGGTVFVVGVVDEVRVELDIVIVVVEDRSRRENAIRILFSSIRVTEH